MKRKLMLKGTAPDGGEYVEDFNSYYLAIVQKQALAKQGYELEIIEPPAPKSGFSSNTTGRYGKYTKAEKKVFKGLRPAKTPRTRVFRSNFK